MSVEFDTPDILEVKVEILTILGKRKQAMSVTPDVNRAIQLMEAQIGLHEMVDTQYPVAENY